MLTELPELCGGLSAPWLAASMKKEHGTIWFEEMQDFIHLIKIVVEFQATKQDQLLHNPQSTEGANVHVLSDHYEKKQELDFYIKNDLS